MLPPPSRLVALALLALCPPAAAQSLGARGDHGAATLAALVAGLTVTPRVLVIGAQPDDQPAELIAWLSRGRHIETGYLSLTRGESGPNFGGEESGTTLGVIRTQELLASRRIDGAEQFFTRGYDFGFARNEDEVFKHWNRDSTVGDIVAVIRAFRPHVIIVAFADTTGADGMHRALPALVDDAFSFATDAVRYRADSFGDSWSAGKLYQLAPPDTGALLISTDEYDPGLGKTYPEIAMESRAQHRSQGLSDVLAPHATTIALRAVRVHGMTLEQGAPSLFTGIDTSFGRFTPGAQSDLATVFPQIVATADSARRSISLNDRATAIPQLARVIRLADRVRALAPWCHHPSSLINAPVLALGAAQPGCDARSLDVDASIDLVRDRAVGALLAADNITLQATADRDLVASSDSALVTVTMANHGSVQATLADVTVFGDGSPTMPPVIVRPESTFTMTRRAGGLETPHPWWIANRTHDRYPGGLSSLDGLTRPGLQERVYLTPSISVREELRRTSDVVVTLAVGGVTFSTSIGPVLVPHADAQVGLQYRPLAGVPDVTLRFERRLEFVPTSKAISRTLRVMVTSHADQPQTIAFKAVLPSGLHLDSLPRELTVAPHEQRDVVVRLRGTLDADTRLPLGLIGIPVPARDSGGAFQTGFLTVQRDYLPPIRTFGSSAFWVQPVKVEVPPSLTVLYVAGIGEDLASVMRQINVVAREVTPEELLSVDLSRIKTVLVGARALDANPELASQAGRLVDFARAGGTLVVLRGGASTTSSRFFPAPITVGAPAVERVVRNDAPVEVLDRKSRLLSWPNLIDETDWKDWVSARAPILPSAVDRSYVPVIEMHDPDQPANRNAILISHPGRGTIIYTALTLDQQIAGGVPGALRLLVNLLSAGLSPTPQR